MKTGIWFIHLVLLALLGTFFPCSAQTEIVSVGGRVVDSRGHIVFQALVELISGPANKSQNMLTDQSGGFQFKVQPGTYVLIVSAPDFQESRKNDLIISSDGCFIEVTLAEIKRESIEVKDVAGGGVYENSAELSRSLPNRLIDLLPVNGSKKSLERVLSGQPGVIGTQSGIYVYGNRPDEVNYRLNGLNIAHPLTFTLPPSIGVETVAQVELLSSRYLPEHGGAGGSILIETQNGTEKFKFSVTNVFPGVSLIEQRGLVFDSWNPKFNFSGPIDKNFRYYNGTTIDYSKSIFIEMPKGKDEAYSWNASNFFGIQGVISPRNIFSAGVLGSILYAPLAGLSPLDPPEVTHKDNEHQIFFYLKDTFVPRPSVIVEIAFARTSVFHQETPRGDEMLQFHYNGRSGNAMLAQNLGVDRNEFLTNASFVHRSDGSWLMRDHKVKIGTDLQFYGLDESTRRSGYQFYRVNDTLASEVRYGGNNLIEARNYELGSYVQDVWSLYSWLVAGFGVRHDYNGRLGGGAITPRANLAFIPPRFKNKTRFAVGVARIPQSAPLYMLTRPLGQYSIMTSFNQSGMPIAGSTVNEYFIDRTILHMPVLTNFSFGVEQQLPYRLRISLNILRKWGDGGFVYDLAAANNGVLPDDAPPNSALIFYKLTNGNSYHYHSIELSVVKNLSFSGFKGEFSVTGTHSEARAKAAMDIGIDTPVRYSSTSGVLPWDVPNRVVGWGLIDLPRLHDSRLGMFFDWRSGLPYTVRNDEGAQFGGFDSWRLPKYCTLNFRFEKGISLIGRRWILRLGVENILDRGNPQMVNENISSPLFGEYLGKQSRKYEIGIRLAF